MKTILTKRIAYLDWVAWTDDVPFRGEGSTKAEAVGDLFIWLLDLDEQPVIEIREAPDKPHLVAAGKGGAA